MINFIIYEDEEKFRDRYFSIIEKFIGKSKLAYEITELKNYSNRELKKLDNISGQKIYILDIQVPGKSGLDFAREIRSKGDWTSQIIIVTSHDNLMKFEYQSKILMLAFISKFYDLDKILLETIQQAHNILTNKENIQFQKFGKLYNIPVNDVLYIEKEPEETLGTIVTAEKPYPTSKNLIQWEKCLENDPRFIKVHRSYIVNIYNIRTIDLETGEIFFDKNKVAYFSRSHKKEIKEIMSKKGIEHDK